MSKQLRAVLKSYFETGDVPTQAQFENFLDSVEAFLNEGGDYKRYVAKLTQSGVNAPVAVVLENTIGNIVWTRSNIGEYVGTLVGEFPEARTTSFMGSGGSAIPAQIDRFDDDSFFIATYAQNALFPLSDDQLNDTHVEIRVYNV